METSISGGKRAWLSDTAAVATRLVDLIARPSRRELGRSSALLALDWSGAQTEMLVGRDDGCDVVLPNVAVSRRHARLLFRDGRWIIQDLDSTNGTAVNGRWVGRCELRPGDDILLGDEHLTVD
ncbi:MAG: FHA domain-containing protein [Solirubrobacteraceae bacterium]